MENDLKKIHQSLENHEKRISQLESFFKEKPKRKKELSVKEFILEKNPKDDIQRTLTISFYLENYQDYESFTVKDIKEGFLNAREKIPSNVNQMVNENIKKGFMMPVKKKDKMNAWVITNTGQKFVENGLKTDE